MRELPDDHLSYPVLIHIGSSSGSGFYVRSDTRLFLVSAKHVFYKPDAEGGELYADRLVLTSYGNGDTSWSKPILLKVDLSQVPIRKSDAKDIVVIEIGAYSKGSTNSGSFNDGVELQAEIENPIVVVPPQHLKKFSEVLVSNDVFILGYPSSIGLQDANDGLRQIPSNKPLLRKGIIAGLNTELETIILDCPVYFGNSGGIAIEVGRDATGSNFKVIGVVSQYVPYIETLTSDMGYKNINIENSGYAIAVPVDSIIELTKDDPEAV